MTWQEANEKRKKYIQMGENLFFEMFSDVRRKLLKEIKQVDEVAKIEGVVEDFDFSMDMRSAYERFYTRTAEAYRKDTIERLKSSGKRLETKQDRTGEILEFVRSNVMYRISEVIETHYDDIKNVALEAVRQGINEGLGFDDVAKMIANRQGEIDEWKALRIARTEAVAASNYGTELGASELPGNKKKVWISSFTTSSREDHMEMDGVEVGIGESFRLPDGTRLEFPGDPSGPAGQVINCRCAEEIIIKDDIF